LHIICFLSFAYFMWSNCKSYCIPFSALSVKEQAHKRHSFLPPINELINDKHCFLNLNQIYIYYFVDQILKLILIFNVLNDNSTITKHIYSTDKLHRASHSNDISCYLIRTIHFVLFHYMLSMHIKHCVEVSWQANIFLFGIQEYDN